MKIISFGDIHEDTSNLVKMKSVLEKADLVVLSGDLTNCQGKDAAQKVVESVRKYNKNLLAQFGNMDLQDVDGYLTNEGVNLHGNGYVIGDVGIFGCGGSSPTPFRTPSEISEQVIDEHLRRGYNRVKGARWKIMVCHTPPKDTLTDVIRGGIHVGSPIVRDFIVKHKPDLCITGHIHESRNNDAVGGSPVFNAGAFQEGWYIEVSVDKHGVFAALKSEVSS